MRLRIKELREEHKMTQKELALKLNNAQRNVSNWESGASEPDCETILELAELFDVSIDELFGREIFFSATQNSAISHDDLSVMISRLSAEQRIAVKNLILSFIGNDR